MLPGDYIVVYGDRILVFTIIRLLYASKYLALPKYVSSTSNGLWRLHGIKLERVLESYSAISVHKAIRASFVQRDYIPNYGVEVTTVPPASPLVYHCKGGSALAYLLAKCKPTLLCEVLDQLNIPLEGLRITGSLLLDFMHKKSDIDLVIGDYNRILDYMLLTDLEDRKRTFYSSEYCNNQYKSYVASIVERGLSTKVAKKTAFYTRICLERPISISIVSDNLRLREERRFFIINRGSVVESTLCFEGLEESALDYPSIASAENNTIVSFDTLLGLPFFLGGCYKVKGLSGKICFGLRDCIEAVFIGLKEFRGLVSNA